MKINSILIIILGLLFSFSSCTEKEIDVNGTGALNVSVQMGNKIDVDSRAIPSDDELLQNCLIQIYDSSDDLVDEFNGISSASDIYLKSGDYKVVVEAGEAVSASFDHIYYKGEATFTIVANQSTPVTVECTIQNALVVVNFDASLKKAFASYQTTVYVSQSSSLEFDETKSGSDVVGYFTLTSAETLTASFLGKKEDGSQVATDPDLFTAKPATQYNLTYKLTSEAAVGNGMITLEVEETPLRTKNDDVYISRRPVISGEGFDLGEVQTVDKDDQNVVFVINVEATSALTSVILTGEELMNVGFNGNELELMEQNDPRITFFKEDEYSAVITLTKEFTRNFTATVGTYNFTVKATDEKDKEREATLTMAIENSVITNDIINYEVWAKKATLRGSYSGDISGTVSFNYRKVGETIWNTIPAAVAGQNFSAEITGLTPGTTYEYQAVIEDVVSASKMFTTEEATQLPNRSFEEWYSNRYITFTYWIPNASKEDKFWDCGNEGAKAAYGSVTNYDEDFVKEGTRSAKLESKYFTLKYAAGNLYSGEYVKTDGTDGILDFGRPFTSRPSKFSFWYKYEGGTINRVTTSYLTDEVIAAGAVKDSPDKARVYIALTDWDEPLRIQTKVANRNLFDVNDPAIIAFGELVRDSSTEGDGWHNHIIDLIYRSQTRIPKYILIVCTSSIFGDYFTGSDSSKLWLDDFELIYE